MQEQAVSPSQPHSIPWFGAVQGWALVPPEASINEFDDPTAIMVLTEGGQLMVHDLKTFQPVPLSLPFQELQAVTHCCMGASATETDPGGSTLQGAAKLHSVTLDRLRVSPEQHVPADDVEPCTVAAVTTVLALLCNTLYMVSVGQRVLALSNMTCSGPSGWEWTVLGAICSGAV